LNRAPEHRADGSGRSGPGRTDRGSVLSR
jgi:hypothetical protein